MLPNWTLVPFLTSHLPTKKPQTKQMPGTFVILFWNHFGEEEFLQNRLWYLSNCCLYLGESLQT